MRPPWRNRKGKGTTKKVSFTNVYTVHIFFATSPIPNVPKNNMLVNKFSNVS
jgi:hypothetical protein